MKTGQRLWTRDELILAINLYCKLPFGKLHRHNPEVIKLAHLIDRSVNSVALKLVNFASLDPSLQARGIKGAGNVSKLDRVIWNEFFNNWNRLTFESEELLAIKSGTSIERLNEIDENELPRHGRERERLVKTRVNQAFFRKSILASYNYTCCITGLQEKQLLIAAHIRPWGEDEKNRLNPRNGLTINALHDKAFENGLIAITEDYKIRISSIIMKQEKNVFVAESFIRYDGKKMILPTRFLPDPEFLKYHLRERFKR
jgi:putative restriction endonuclease